MAYADEVDAVDVETDVETDVVVDEVDALSAKRDDLLVKRDALDALTAERDAPIAVTDALGVAMGAVDVAIEEVLNQLDHDSLKHTLKQNKKQM